VKCILVTATCVCLSLAAFPHYCTDPDPDVTWGMLAGALYLFTVDLGGFAIGAWVLLL